MVVDIGKEEVCAVQDNWRTARSAFCVLTCLIALAACAQRVAAQRVNPGPERRASLAEVDRWYSNALQSDLCAKPNGELSAPPSRVESPVVAVAVGLSVVERGDDCWVLEDTHCVQANYRTRLRASTVQLLFDGGSGREGTPLDMLVLTERPAWVSGVGFVENLMPLVRADGRYLVFGGARNLGDSAGVRVTAMCDISARGALARLTGGREP